MQEVARQSGGKYRMGSGTLYDNLEKLMEQGLVAEAPPPINKGRSHAGNYYRMTTLGRRIFLRRGHAAGKHGSRREVALARGPDQRRRYDPYFLSLAALSASAAVPRALCRRR